MLRDNFKTYNPPSPNDLSAKENLEVIIILDFIDCNISGFRPYYLSTKESNRENWITDCLVHYFNTCLLYEKTEGFPPFNFGKNPAQAHSGKETDIGVVVLTKNIKPLTVIEFEAKRLSLTSNNKEYVSGKRGGIERFKRELHAAHLSICGMFGYVQSNTTTEWIEKINTWLTELAEIDDDSIDWKKNDEKLVELSDFDNTKKCTSINVRANNNSIKLFHYFIQLN